MKMLKKYNYEFKAYYNDLQKAEKICSDMGAKKIRTNAQIDTYFSVKHGKLKIREDNNQFSLIYYKRLNTAKARSCNYEKVDLTDQKEVLFTILNEALGEISRVKKERISFVTEQAIINIDKFDLIGNFVEVEVLMEKTKSKEEAVLLAKELQTKLEVRSSDIVSFSYADLSAMYEKADFWRNEIESQKNPGRLFLLDGCSCSGKTTLIHHLFKETPLKLRFIPRYCTRDRRKNEKTEDEYIFITSEYFNKIASRGELIEYRDFEFGMSYGISWEDAITPILSGYNSLGVINLGNIVHVKKIFPEAVTILINAPIDTIRKRLLERGYNNTEQIEERIENAKTVSALQNQYDYVINNEDGMLEQSLNSIKKIISTEIKN